MVLFHLFRDLKHQNICQFHGCLLSDSYTALLYEYCSRGSLESILLRSDIQFDCEFRLSFAMDAAQAMAFLHSKKIVHGTLNTSNCMIDERWTLKIQGKCCSIICFVSKLMTLTLNRFRTATATFSTKISG